MTPEPTAGDVALACVSAMLAELRPAGVCVSPGSRSTPLALAAARTPDLPLWPHLDERSSAFFALGLAKASGRPVAVVCTSGTAAAEFYPAVIEAAQARVPLVLLTADRPPRLRGTGANQTIDQVRLYGSYPRLFEEAPLPKPGSGGLWRALGARVRATALGPPAGPVHLNLPFDEPLVPAGAEVDLGPAGPAVATEAASRPVRGQDLSILFGALERERGAIVAGGLPSPAPAVAELARVAAWPLLAEPASGMRAGDAMSVPDALAERFTAEVVVQVGSTPTTRAMLGFVARAGRLIVVDADGFPTDPAGHASHAIAADPEALARAVLARAATRSPAPWLDEWKTADARLRPALDAALDASDEPGEQRAARDLARALPAGATLVVANSAPVRDLCLAMEPRDGLRVLANRGASGIDGFVSTALGVAAAGSPTAALAGDLSLLHDVGGLAWAASHGHDLTLVVVNNDGGGVFDRLATRGLPEHEGLFVMPHGIDLWALATAIGARHALVGSARELPALVGEALGRRGIDLIELRIDREQSLTRLRALTEGLARA
ncbi:MAG TPA: 2-succinyl-5-enolpyruvyl-6-hydroxy-3-cyclohexene-1-carboxylic-acid synthase [Actinomycetota bacterium]